MKLKGKWKTMENMYIIHNLLIAFLSCRMYVHTFLSCIVNTTFLLILSSNSSAVSKTDTQLCA